MNLQGEDDLVRDFVTEAKEHLESVETDLLRLEQDLAHADADTVNRLFRSVHSVKGAAGFLGFGQVQKLSHVLEGTLDLVRKDQLAPTHDLVDVLLQAVDQLGALVADITASEASDIEANVQRLQGFLPGMRPVALETRLELIPRPIHRDGDSEPLLTATEEEVAIWTAGGRRLWRLTVPLAAISLATGKEISEIPMLLATLGDVVRGATRLIEYVEGNRPSLQPVHLVLVSAADENEIARVLGLELDFIETIVVQPMGRADAPALAARSAEPAPVAEASVGIGADVPPAAASERAPATASTPKAARSEGDPHGESIRVAVGVLDRLMNLSGELVLGRNQLLQAIGAGGAVETIAARLSQVVSETQEVVMQTRMQPVGNLFGRFPRIVRDLAARLGKSCALEVEGKEVELDRSLLEALTDPMTHLVRNALDHGIEAPDVRERVGKSREGTLFMRAAHQGGDVRIEIRDDGRGIDHEMLRRKVVEKGLMTVEEARALSATDAVHLIFHPGFSTAETVTDVSGRGVGMDVVRSNVERLGGSVDVDTRLGQGTTFSVTLPLTLAILPALVVSNGEQRYVIPQANVAELVRLRNDEVAERVVRIGGRDILRLRGALLPLVHLTEVLAANDAATDDGASRVWNVLVIASGALRYGLVVSAPPDAEEIVVKPLGRHLKRCREYSGATILGDGRVALILDVAGLPELMELSSVADEIATRATQAPTETVESTEVVLLCNHPTETFAVPLCLVRRIQRLRRDQVQQIGRELVFATDARVLPLMRLSDVMSALAADDFERCYLLVLKVGDQEVGLIAPILLDVRRIDSAIDDRTLVEPGVLGSFQMGERGTVRLLDVTTLATRALPHLCQPAPTPPPATATDESTSAPSKILLAEDSTFFRAHVQRILESAGFVVEATEDGEEAWVAMNDHGSDFALVLTDVEMPRCDGLELTRRIRGDQRFAGTRVIALTSLSSDQAVADGRAAGVDEYLVKLDDAELVSAVHRNVGRLA
ncbi:MAG: chemotaxis protein CheW [Planctomycetota bacterium]